MKSDEELDRLKAELPRSITPLRDLWPGISGRISQAKVVPLTRPAWRRPALLAAAAVALVVITATTTTIILRNQTPGFASHETPRGMVTDFASVEAEYMDAASEILRAVKAGEVKLSPATVAVLERNVQVIDDAIAESREALAKDPANAALREMVLASFRHKLDLLRRATAAL